MADDAPSYPLLESTWPSGAAFLSRFEVGEKGMTLEQPYPRIADLPEHPIGAILLVRLLFEDRAIGLNLHARVLERREGREGVSLLLGFLDEERERVELALTCAEGQSVPFHTRKSRRISCRVPLTVKAADGHRHRTTTLNLSEGGAAISLGPLAQLEIGSVARLALEPKGGERLTLSARVVSIVRRGPQPSISVEFQFSSSSERDRWRARFAEIAAAAPR